MLFVFAFTYSFFEPIIAYMVTLMIFCIMAPIVTYHYLSKTHFNDTGNRKHGAPIGPSYLDTLRTYWPIFTYHDRTAYVILFFLYYFNVV
eukprot:UN19355